MAKSRGASGATLDRLDAKFDKLQVRLTKQENRALRNDASHLDITQRQYSDKLRAGHYRKDRSTQDLSDQFKRQYESALEYKKRTGSTDFDNEIEDARPLYQAISANDTGPEPQHVFTTADGFRTSGSDLDLAGGIIKVPKTAGGEPEPVGLADRRQGRDNHFDHLKRLKDGHEEAKRLAKKYPRSGLGPLSNRQILDFERSWYGLTLSALDISTKQIDRVSGILGWADEAVAFEEGRAQLRQHERDIEREVATAEDDAQKALEIAREKGVQFLIEKAEQEVKKARKLRARWNELKKQLAGAKSEPEDSDVQVQPLVLEEPLPGGLLLFAPGSGERPSGRGGGPAPAPNGKSSGDVVLGPPGSGTPEDAGEDSDSTSPPLDCKGCECDPPCPPNAKCVCTPPFVPFRDDGPDLEPDEYKPPETGAVPESCRSCDPLQVLGSSSSEV